MDKLQRYLPWIAFGMVAVLAVLWVLPGLLQGGSGLLLLAAGGAVGFFLLRRRSGSGTLRPTRGARIRPAEPTDEQFPDELELTVWQVAKRTGGQVRAEDVSEAVPGITLALAEEILQLMVRQGRAVVVESGDGDSYLMRDPEAEFSDEPPLLN